jgi:Xaa-Pro aminopeptidase
MKKEIKRHGFKPAWTPDICPIVSVGKNSLYGHHRPGNTKISRGKIVHIDFGVFDGMCSDMQRTYYVLKRGERSAPKRIVEMFEVQVASKAAAMREMRPGVKGTDVDAAARKVVKDAGFKDYKHATGHTVARSTHAIGPGPYPSWPTYGKLGQYPLEVSNVVTVEPSVIDEEIGDVSTEDDVLVTGHEAISLNAQQSHLLYIR